MLERRAHLCWFLPSFLLATAGCAGGGGGGDPDVLAGVFELQVVSNGFGQLLPHTVLRMVDGAPTNTVIPIRRREDLLANVSPSNPVLPVTRFPVAAVLPNQQPGNHFFYARFAAPLDVTSIFSLHPGSGLTGAATLTRLDPSTRISSTVAARVFVDGWTVVDGGGAPRLERWIERDAGSNALELVTIDGERPGAGFPGAPGSEFTNGAELVRPDTLVFVADADGDLATVESFPAGGELQLRLGAAVRSTGGASLAAAALASTGVGPDTCAPEIAQSAPPLSTPSITPGNGDQDVDPTTPIRVRFTEPVQPSTLGSLPGPLVAPTSAAVQIEFGPPAHRVSVPFVAMPPSVYDLSLWELTPGFALPGEGPAISACGVFNEVDVRVQAQQVRDLAGNPNALGATTQFSTGEGPGLVNAPVAPAAIYVARSGATPSVSILDLDGFGQGTGNPRNDPLHPAEGDTNFVNNPNLVIYGTALYPPLEPGQCTVNGGSAGVFTLTKDSSLDDRLARAPLVRSIVDLMIGHALDKTYNLGPVPYGCQSGGNICASAGKQVIMAAVNGNSMGPPLTTGVIPGTPQHVGPGNIISWAPHPNPPPLVFPPPCISPPIGGQEPTSVDSIVTSGFTNLLAPGDPFGDPLNGIPPSGLLTPEQNTFFEGPSRPGTAIQNCTSFSIRQQVGHFLYALDRERHELVIFNSNRMTVLDRIELADPTTLAMSPNLDLLAITNQLANSVTFVDIDPLSSTFHQVVQETGVPARPRGIAWDPGNEDVLVTCEGDNSVAIVSAGSLQVRKIVRSQLTEPFDVAITERQVCWGYNRNVYFAWILNRDGSVALFESGPGTVNGWGYDDVIGVAPMTFQRPKAIQPDPNDMRSAVWIAHEGALQPGTNASGPVGEGAVSKLAIVSGLNGMLPLNLGAFAPQLRDMAFGVPVSVGLGQITGIPVDIAFDDLRNWGGMTGFSNVFSAGQGIQLNSKALIRGTCPNVGPTNHARYLFAAVPNPVSGTGVIDVLRIDQGAARIDTSAWRSGLQSVPAPGVSALMGYFRQ